MSTSSGQIVDPAGVQQCQDALGLPGAAVALQGVEPDRHRVVVGLHSVGLPRNDVLPSLSEVTRERQALMMQL